MDKMAKEHYVCLKESYPNIQKYKSMKFGLWDRPEGFPVFGQVYRSKSSRGPNHWMLGTSLNGYSDAYQVYNVSEFYSFLIIFV
jgi:hypothetical protein